jgi:hypothetical protein
MNVSTVATLKMKAVETKRKSRRSTLCQTIPGDGLVSFSNASSLNKRETLADMSDDAIEKLKRPPWVNRSIARCKKVRAQTRNWLDHKEGGIKWDVFIMMLSAFSVVIYILQTYAESNNPRRVLKISEEEYTTTMVLEFACACFFAIDFSINMVAAKHPLRYMLLDWGLVDLVTVYPVLYSTLYTGFKRDLGTSAIPPEGVGNQDTEMSKTDKAVERYAVYSTEFMSIVRFARIFKVTRFLREMRLQKLFRSKMTQGASQILAAIVSLLAIWFLAAGMVYFVECELPHMRAISEYTEARLNASSYNVTVPFVPFEKPMTFGDSLYFSMISMTTVGYGDIAPKTATGMWVTMVIIILGLVLIGEKLGIIADVFNRQNKYKRKYYGSLNSCGHIVIMGDGVRDTILLLDILADHFHPDNCGGDDRPSEEDVVIMGSENPTEVMRREILESFLGEKLTYYIGSILSPVDLENIQLKKAQLVFILADCRSKDVHQADHQNIVNALVVREYDQHAMILANCHLVESAFKISEVARPQLLLCNDEIRTAIISGALACPGLQILFDNLSSGFDFNAGISRPFWLQEYYKGASKELYCIPVTEFFAEKTFVEAACWIFRVKTQDASNLVLLAVEYDGDYFVNPGPTWRLPGRKFFKRTKRTVTCHFYIIANNYINAALILDPTNFVDKGPIFPRNDVLFDNDQMLDTPTRSGESDRELSDEDEDLFSTNITFPIFNLETGQRTEVFDFSGHIVICGKVRQALSVVNTYRKLQGKLKRYSSTNPGTEIDYIPAIIVTPMSHPEARETWMADHFDESMLRNIYHIRGRSTNNAVLHRANIRSAAAVVIFDDDSVYTNKGTRELSGEYIGSDTYILLTYISLNMCLTGVPRKFRPRIVIETNSSMTLHVLTKKMIAYERESNNALVGYSTEETSEDDVPMSKADCRRGGSRSYQRRRKTMQLDQGDRNKEPQRCSRCPTLRFSTDFKSTYDHDYIAIPGYVSGYCINVRSINGFLGHARFAPGLFEIFQSLVSTEMADASSVIRIKVPTMYWGKTFGDFFEAMLAERGGLILALYRCVHATKNDNYLPYVFTAPNRNVKVHDGDGALILMPPTCGQFSGNAPSSAVLSRKESDDRNTQAMQREGTRQVTRAPQAPSKIVELSKSRYRENHSPSPDTFEMASLATMSSGKPKRASRVLHRELNERSSPGYWSTLSPGKSPSSSHSDNVFY